MTVLKNPVHPAAHINHYFVNGKYAEIDGAFKTSTPILPDTLMMCLAAILKPMGAVRHAMVSEYIVPGQFVVFDHRPQFTDIFQTTLGIALKTCSECVACHRFI